MPPFSYAGFDHPVPEDITQALREAWERLAGGWVVVDRGAAGGDRSRGSSGSGAAQRAAVAARGAGRSDRIAFGRGRRGRRGAWPSMHISSTRSGVTVWSPSSATAAYVELVSAAVFATIADAFAEALGAEFEEFPEPQPGEPDRARPESVGEAGAWVPMTVPWAGPNVGRALSLAPGDHLAFMNLVSAMYSLGDFTKLVWERPLSRPQVELVASRVSAVNECFY